MNANRKTHVFLLQAIIICIKKKEFDKASKIIRKHMAKDPSNQVNWIATGRRLWGVGQRVCLVLGLITEVGQELTTSQSECKKTCLHIVASNGSLLEFS